MALWEEKNLQRCQVALGHRVRCAWTRRHSLQRSLLNEGVDIERCLELLNATVIPAVVYGLDACALDKKPLERLVAIQRKNTPPHGLVGVRWQWILRVCWPQNEALT